jgi:hypothetical protein
MTMNKALIFAIGVVSTAVVTTAHTQTYRWTDANGKTVISDKAPPANVRDARSIGTPKPKVVVDSTTAAPGEAASPQPQSMAEKEQEFRKRLQEGREKAEKDAKEAAQAKARQENCEQARRQLAALESDQPIARLNDKGERQLLDKDQRQQELDRMRGIAQSVCQ